MKPRNPAFLEAKPRSVGVAGCQERKRVTHPRLVTDARDPFALEPRKERGLGRPRQALDRNPRAIGDRIEKLGGLHRSKPGTVVDVVEAEAGSTQAFHDRLEPRATLVGQRPSFVGKPCSPILGNGVSNEKEIHRLLRFETRELDPDGLE